MTLKTLVTGIAAAAAVAGAAAGVTSIASPAIASAEECAVDPGTLQGVLNTLADPNISFYPGKEGLVQGGVGRVKGKFADAELKNAYATGTLPVAFNVDPPTCVGNQATSTVSAGSQSMQLTFVNEGTWKLSSGSAAAVLAAFGG